MLPVSPEIWQQCRRRASQSARLCRAAVNRTERTTRCFHGLQEYLVSCSLRFYVCCNRPLLITATLVPFNALNRFCLLLFLPDCISLGKLSAGGHHHCCFRNGHHNILDIRWAKSYILNLQKGFLLQLGSTTRLLSAEGLIFFCTGWMFIFSAWVKIQLQDIDRNANVAVYGEPFLTSGPGAPHQSACTLNHLTSLHAQS